MGGGMAQLSKALPLLAASALLGACSDSADATKGEEPSPWAGHTYLLSIVEGDWVEPRAVGREIGPNVPSFLFQVEGTTASDLTLTLGAGQPQATPETFQQNLCSPTQTV